MCSKVKKKAENVYSKKFNYGHFWLERLYSFYFFCSTED